MLHAARRAGFSRNVKPDVRVPFSGLRSAAERKRAAPVFVTGWRSRESLSAARRGDIPTWLPLFRRSPSAPRATSPSTSWCSASRNVRRVKAGVSIEELAEDIARRTLLQGLSVRPVLDADGSETGMFEVPAGGRRYRALELLVKQKRLAKTAPVPCVVRDPSAGISPRRIRWPRTSSASPCIRSTSSAPSRPCATRASARRRSPPRFFVAPTVVKQRLRLAAVSAKLLDVYAEDGMTLEQLMAFTVTGDHARQEQVWEALSALLQQGALLHPPHADRRRGPGVRPARAVRRHRSL